MKGESKTNSTHVVHVQSKLDCAVPEEMNPTSSVHSINVFGIISFLIWTIIPYVGIIILFVLYAFQTSSTTVTHSSSSVGITFASFQRSSSLSSLAISKGSVVSVDNEGLLQLGGGSSIYEIFADTLTACPKFVDIDALYGNAYLVYFSHQDTRQSTLHVIAMGDDLLTNGKVSATLSSTTMNNFPYYVNRVRTLSQSKGIFITIAENWEAKGAPGQGTVMAGKVSTDLATITLGTSVSYSEGGYSVHPYLIRLSETSFAICYFFAPIDFSDNNLYTRYGTVDPLTLTITLSEAKFIVGDSSYKKNPLIVPLSATSYFLVIADKSQGMSDDKYHGSDAGLASIIPVSVVYNSISTKNEIVFGKAATLPSVELAYFYAGTRINDMTAVLVYYDYTSNYALKSTVIRLDTSTIGTRPANATAIIGSTYALTTTKTANAGFSSDLEVDTVSTAATDGNVEFAVLFADPANSKATTTILLQVTPTYDIIPVSSKIVLSSPEPKGTLFWGSVTGTDTNSLAMLQVFSSDCSADVTAKISVLELRNKAIGVVTANANAQETVSVALSGTVGGYSNLKPGSIYYTDSRGRLVKTGLAYGQQPSSRSATFIASVNGDTLVSADSLVGVAVAADTLKIIEY